MFVAHETTAALELTTAEHLIDLLREGDLEPGEAAFHEDGRLKARVGPWEEGINRVVLLDLGLAEIHRGGLVYPVNWVAESGSGLFPSLTGELTLSHAGRGRTRFVFRGNYEPPLGPLGKVADRVALGRLADTTVQHWLDDLCASLVAVSAKS